MGSGSTETTKNKAIQKNVRIIVDIRSGRNFFWTVFELRRIQRYPVVKTSAPREKLVIIATRSRIKRVVYIHVFFNERSIRLRGNANINIYTP